MNPPIIGGMETKATKITAADGRYTIIEARDKANEAMEQAWDEREEQDQAAVGLCGCGGACQPCRRIIEEVESEADRLQREPRMPRPEPTHTDGDATDGTVTWRVVRRRRPSN